MTESQTREYIRSLFQQIYRRIPTEQEEREFARSEVFPVLHHLYTETQKAKETA